MTPRLPIAAIVLAILATPAAAQDARSAEAFLRGLYAGYAPGKKAPEPLGKDAERLFVPALAGLIKADAALSVGAVGVLDADPICACQDWQKLTVKKVAIEPDGPKRLTATVLFDNDGAATTVRYSLESVEGKWKIANLSEPGLDNMRRMLADGVAARAKELAK